jgi:hypothetical protein
MMMDNASDGLTLDGNALAGLLGELLPFEATTLLRTCSGCGEQHPLGAHRAYRGAGYVLRCPGCGAAALVVAVSEQHVTARVHGALRITRPA